MKRRKLTQTYIDLLTRKLHVGEENFNLIPEWVESLEKEQLKIDEEEALECSDPNPKHTKEMK